MSFQDIARTAFWLTVAAAISIALLYIYAVPLAGAPMWAAVASSVLGWAVSVPFAAMMGRRQAEESYAREARPRPLF